jgi:hypothetical protein
MVAYAPRSMHWLVCDDKVAHMVASSATWAAVPWQNCWHPLPVLWQTTATLASLPRRALQQWREIRCDQAAFPSTSQLPVTLEQKHAYGHNDEAAPEVAGAMRPSSVRSAEDER